MSLQGETKRQEDEYQRADFDFSMLLIPNIVGQGGVVFYAGSLRPAVHRRHEH